MSEFEKNVTRYERLARRIIAADKKLAAQEKQLARRGGIYGSESVQALPSAFVRKNKRLEEAGLIGGRLGDSNQKKTGQKFSPELEDAKLNIADSIASALGIKINREQAVTSGSLVGSSGAPIRKANRLQEVEDDVSNLKTNQKAFAKLFSEGQSIVGGAAGLTSADGIIGNVLGFATRIPHVAAIIGIATVAVKAYFGQYGPGGRRDKRKKVLAEDDSIIGIENENLIANGEILFFSNPSSLQGLPRGHSNTQNLRNGVARYNQRHRGSYD